MAEKTEYERMELPPLYESVDPDVLERVARATTPADEPPIQITFGYCGCTVIVDSDGAVSATRRDDDHGAT